MPCALALGQFTGSRKFSVIERADWRGLKCGMRYGVLILPETRWTQSVDRWRTAEALGFDHAWTYDHLTWRSLQDKPWFGAVPTLAAAASVTSTLRLGTLVASPNFREPAPFAKDLMTLDDISNGRITLGFGAGADGYDATATRSIAWTPKERQERFAEFVTALDQILTEPKSNFSGAYYVANETRAIPGCLQKPRLPFAIAATGTKSMRVVAQYADTWIAVDSRFAPGQLDLLNRACDENGRDPTQLNKIILLGHRETPLSSVDAFFEHAAYYESLGFTDFVVHWPRDEAPFEADMSVLEEVGAALPQK